MGTSSWLYPVKCFFNLFFEIKLINQFCNECDLPMVLLLDPPKMWRPHMVGVIILYFLSIAPHGSTLYFGGGSVHLGVDTSRTTQNVFAEVMRSNTLGA